MYLEVEQRRVAENPPRRQTRRDAEQALKVYNGVKLFQFRSSIVGSEMSWRNTVSFAEFDETDGRLKAFSSIRSSWSLPRQSYSSRAPLDLY